MASDDEQAEWAHFIYIKLSRLPLRSSLCHAFLGVIHLIRNNKHQVFAIQTSPNAMINDCTTSGVSPTGTIPVKLACRSANVHNVLFAS